VQLYEVNKTGKFLNFLYSDFLGLWGLVKMKTKIDADLARHSLHWLLKE
jgi:hypothetical protein